MADIVFVHGVGGATPEKSWLESLNHGLQQMGYPTLRPDFDRVTTVDYSHCFGSNVDVPAPARTVRPADEEIRARARFDFARAQQEMLRRIKFAEGVQRDGLSRIPDAFQNFVAPAFEHAGNLGEIKRYLDESSLRHAIWKQVRIALSRTHNPIVVAHSMGSVVMADVLGHLPESVTIDLLVTIGSPLRNSRYRKHAPAEFPYWAIRRWLNIYSPWDVVTGGGGIAQRVDQAVDVPVSLGQLRHASPAYLTTVPVATTVGSRVFDPDSPEENTADVRRDASIARRVHKSWYPLLLTTTFTGQIADDLPSKSWRLRLQLRQARYEVAQRAATDIRQSARQLEQRLADLRSRGFSPDEAALDDHPLAPGRYPTAANLTAGSASLLAGMIDEQSLLTFTIALLLQPLVPPFDIRIEPSRRQTGLEDTLNIVRGPSRAAGAGLSDRRFAKAAVDALEWAQGELAKGGFPWGAVLIGSGVAVLAATGVGAVFAAPAGLAGAAVVTSTLAAVGPGGMIGGLATLGALTGTGASLTALGVREGLAGAAKQAEAVTALARSGRDLVAEPLPSLRVALTASLAVVKSRQVLDFESSAESVNVSFEAALAAALAERQLHRDIAPDGKSVDEWNDKVELLERALAVLGSIAPVRDDSRLALKNGQDG